MLARTISYEFPNEYLAKQFVIYASDSYADLAFLRYDSVVYIVVMNSMLSREIFRIARRFNGVLF